MAKRRTNKNKDIHTNKKSNLILLFFAILLILFGIFLIFNNGNRLRIASNGQNSLQIGQMIFSTPSITPPSIQTPTPTQTGEPCNHDNGKPAQVNDGKPIENPTCYCPAVLLRCKDRRCAEVYASGGNFDYAGPCPKFHPDRSDEPSPYDSWCSLDALAPTDGVYCIGKPVIYLYPTRPTLVDVSIKTEGDIFVSDPLYPDGGWKNVLAEPGGRLTYQGKTYKELFYETNVEDIKKPNSGLTLDTTRLRGELDTVISRLGLVGEEKTEFLDYWVPRLKALNSKYIFFSIVEEEEKKRIDHVSYSPEPDTRIEFIAYFAPLERLYTGEVLVLPETPKRVGFTVVEWGGVIGK